VSVAGGTSATILDRQRRRRVARAPLVRVVASAGTIMRSRHGEVAVVLGGDTLLRRLNREYRGKDRTTDVLSFAADPDDGESLGDIAISVPMAERNARKAGHALGRELEILVLHGFLHLLGFDHETDGGQMSRLEMRLRRRLGLAPQTGR
jgi:probable rRNA maturation factor